ncbi:MAG TPA: hypothetical protein VM124_00465, partial [Candidatus Limnocylindrales bacterium]|nr:hypothetical protein [Candidatus Limnocylindrales bacterium]
WDGVWTKGNRLEASGGIDLDGDLKTYKDNYVRVETFNHDFEHSFGDNPNPGSDLKYVVDGMANIEDFLARVRAVTAATVS